MKVTVLGYWGAFPGAGEATSGYLIEHDNVKLLIDCGSGVLAQLQKFCDVEQLDAVLLSHYHHDHQADIGPLQYAMLIKRILGQTEKTLPIYGHNEDRSAFSKLTHGDNTIGVAYQEDSVLKIGPFSITFLKTAHPVPCYAMSIEAGGERVVYTADTSYINELHSFSEKADLLIAECSFYADQDFGKSAGHLNSTDAGRLASIAEVRTLLLTHLPHFRDHRDLVTEAASQFQGRIELAAVGWSWEGQNE